MKKVIIIMVFALCSACASGNMVHPFHGRDYKQYQLEKECCEIKEKLGGQRYSACMIDWKVMKK